MLGRNKYLFEKRAHVLLFTKIVEKAAQGSFIYFFQLLYLQKRKHKWSETPLLDVNIPAMYNKGMKMASELSELITGNVILSSWIRGKILVKFPGQFMNLNG